MNSIRALSVLSVLLGSEALRISVEPNLVSKDTSEVAADKGWVIPFFPKNPWGHYAHRRRHGGGGGGDGEDGGGGGGGEQRRRSISGGGSGGGSGSGSGGCGLPWESEYWVSMYDSWGDGWDGAELSIMDCNGADLAWGMTVIGEGPIMKNIAGTEKSKEIIIDHCSNKNYYIENGSGGGEGEHEEEAWCKSRPGCKWNVGKCRSSGAAKLRERNSLTHRASRMQEKSDGTESAHHSLEKTLSGKASGSGSGSGDILITHKDKWGSGSGSGSGSGPGNCYKSLWSEPGCFNKVRVCLPPSPGYKVKITANGAKDACAECMNDITWSVFSAQGVEVASGDKHGADSCNSGYGSETFAPTTANSGYGSEMTFAPTTAMEVSGIYGDGDGDGDYGSA